jgi:signal transduction histidine kinase
VATAVAVVGVGAGVGLALLLVPLLTAVVDTTPLWRRSLLVASALFVPALMLWSRRALAPLARPEATVDERRRAAQDFPFRLARVCFGAALASGIATGAGLWIAHRREPSAALAAGVVTYLVLVLPVLAIYLGARGALHRDAAGPPGAEAAPGIRQSVRLRLAMAVQFPVVVCMAGLVLVEQYDDVAYNHTLSQFYQEQYTQVLSRVLAAVGDPGDREALLRELTPPDGITPRAWSVPGSDTVSYGLVIDPDPDRPLDQRLLPFALLLTVALLAALLGRWLSREITGELRSVQRTLRVLRASAGAAEAPPPGTFALRETGALVAALEGAVAAYRARDEAVRGAAEARRRAEQAKSRFLAHLSHELKSPLNSILGFSEVLLGGLDGELTAEQRDKLAIIWRSGDLLLRYILALLDLARLEAGSDAAVDARLLGFEPAPVSAGELVQAIRRQWRADPLQALQLDLRDDAAPGPRFLLDAPRTARAAVLAAGMLLDAVERATAEIVCRLDGTTLVLDVGLRDPVADEADRRHLRDQLEAAGPERPAHIGAATTVVALLRRIATAQGGAFDVEPGPWPRLKFRVPALETLAGAASGDLPSEARTL